MKNISRIIIISFVLVLTISLSACGSESLSAKFSLSALTEGDQEYDLEMLKIAMGENYAEENFVQFKDGSVFTMTLLGSTIEGTYKKKGNEIAMTSEDNNFGDILGQLDGDNLIIEEDGSVFTFTNVKAKKE